MNSPEPRNRVVVFRLSQEEYRALKTACTTRGGRNLSDFTRSELLAMIQSEPLGHMVQKRFSDVEEALANVYSVLRDLNRRLDSVPLSSSNDHRNTSGDGL